MRIRHLLPVLLLLALMPGCGDGARGEEVRTFRLERLSESDARALLDPYVREEGALSIHRDRVTVRESRERLEQIAAVLEEHDAPTPDVTLHFQLIEATRGGEVDPAVADVGDALRGVLRYDGYRLLREVTIRAREGGDFIQSEEGLVLAGSLGRVSTGDDRRVEMEVSAETPDGRLMSRVAAELGRTVVIGTQSAGPDSGAIVLAVRPEVE